MKTMPLFFVSGLCLCAQSLDVKSLNGAYHFVELAIVLSVAGQPIETQNIGGDLGIKRCGLKLLVPKHDLNHADIDLLLQ